MTSNKIVAKNNEVFLKEQDIVISKTDTKGKITYVNRTLMSISGFNETELLGAPHNIIRHPDMPRGVFKMLWDSLQSGKEFMGYIKNITKDGSFYWVFANVTIDVTDAGELKGYYSVRRRPAEAAVKLMLPIYTEMLRIESAGKNRNSVSESVAYLEEHIKGLGDSYNGFLDAMENRG